MPSNASCLTFRFSFFLFLECRYVHVSSSCSSKNQDSFTVHTSSGQQKLTDSYPSMLNQSIAGISASQFLQVPCTKAKCEKSVAIVEASAFLDSVSLVNSIAGNLTVTVVTNLKPNPSFPSPLSDYTFTSIVLTVTNGLPIKVIYYWATNTCSGPAKCTAALSHSCTSVSVSVSSTAFKLPDVALMYLDAGNNVFNVLSQDIAPNNQQVFLNTSLQPKSVCPVPTLYSKFSQISGNSFLSDGKTMNPTLDQRAFPYFENNNRLLELSKYLSENRLISGSRFLITMNGNTFKSGSGSISNVDNNQLSLDVIHGSTFLLAFVDDDWNSRVSTLNVSLGSLKVSAFDSACNVNIGESSALTLNLHFGEIGNSQNCNSSDNVVSFYGRQETYRFVSGKFNTSSLYILRPKSGKYFFCVCTTSSCTSKPFEILSGAPVDLVLTNLSMASSFDRVGQGLACKPSESPDCSSNAYIEFMASSFDINENRVTYSNYSFSVAVQAESGFSQSTYLWEHQAPTIKLTNRSNPLACSLSSPTCKMFLRGVRGAVYSLNISLVNDNVSPASRQLINERRYTLGQSPFALGNASLEHYKDTPFIFASAAVNVAQSSNNLVHRSLPSFSIKSFKIAPCPSGQVSVVDDSANGEKFGRCQCDRGYQQDRLKGDAASRESQSGFGDTITCSFCPADKYQPDVGGAPESCKACQIAGVLNLPSSTLNADGQISASACKCAPDYLYVRPVLLPGTSINVTEVCTGLYNSTAPADCFCLPCDKKKQRCPGGGDFVPLSTSSSNSTVAGTAIGNDVVQGLSYFSFFNNSAYYGFLANTSTLNRTSSTLIQFYKMSSAAMACGVRADGQSSCQTKQIYDRNQCQEGYTGFLCSSCATYDTVRWAESAGKACIKCESDSNLSNFLLFIVLMGILLVCSYFIGEARKPQSVKNKFSVGTKTFLNHLQVISFMSDLQSQWSSLVRSMFSVSNLSNFGVNIGNVGCSVPLSFQSKLLVYCLSPFVISLVPSSIYVIECLVCYRKLVLDTRRRKRLARNNQVPAALLNIDKGVDLDYIQSRYSLEETELLHLTLTWKEHLRNFKKALTQRDDISPEEYIDMRLALGKKLLRKQFWTDSVVVLLVVTFLSFSTISRQIFYTFSLKESASRPNAK